VCWTSGVEVEGLDDALAPHGDCPGEAAAYQSGTEWVMVEGSIAPNDILLPAWSTLGRMRQGPSGRYEWTMGGLMCARRCCRAVSTRVGSGVGGSEREGPG
jgi:hypothetical protein